MQKNNEKYILFSEWDSIQQMAQQDLEFQIWKLNAIKSSLEMGGIILFSDFEDLPDSHNSLEKEQEEEKEIIFP